MAFGRDSRHPITEELIRRVFGRFGDIIKIKTGAQMHARVVCVQNVTTSSARLPQLSPVTVGSMLRNRFGSTIRCTARVESNLCVFPFTGAKDFVFIDYASMESCHRAIDAMHCHPFDEFSNGPMKVQLAEMHRERPNHFQRRGNDRDGVGGYGGGAPGGAGQARERGLSRERERERSRGREGMTSAMGREWHLLPNG